MSFSGIYFFLANVPSTGFEIPKITWTDKTEYRVGEIITVHGFSFQAMHLGCYQMGVYNNTFQSMVSKPKLDDLLSKPGRFLDIYPYACGAGLTYYPPFSFVDDHWNQKSKSVNHKEFVQVQTGKYALYYLGNKMEINIIS